MFSSLSSLTLTAASKLSNLYSGPRETFAVPLWIYKLYVLATYY